MFGTDTVVQVAGEHTFLDNIRFLPLYAFIVEIHGTPIERYRTVIHHVNMFVAHLLVQLTGKYRYILTVEVCLERMPYSLVQQDSRTARTHYNGHFTTFRLNGLK